MAASAYKNSSGQISEPVFLTDENAQQIGISTNPLVVTSAPVTSSSPTVLSRVASSAASGNPAVAKNAAGNVSLWTGINTTGAIVYLQIYNKATAPVLGTDTPYLTVAIPANGRVFDAAPNTVRNSTGIAFAFTTDVAGATGAAAGAITAFAIVGA